jgi:hypothetical protein
MDEDPSKEDPILEAEATALFFGFKSSCGIQLAEEAPGVGGFVGGWLVTYKREMFDGKLQPVVGFSLADRSTAPVSMTVPYSLQKACIKVFGVPHGGISVANYPGRGETLLIHMQPELLGPHALF